METKIQKWGNSLGVRIPGNIVKDLSLKNGSLVDIEEISNKIVIKPKENNNLDEMIDSITESNVHSELDFGDTEGNEIW